MLKLADLLSRVISGPCVFGLTKTNATVTNTAMQAVEGVAMNTVFSICEQNCFGNTDFSTVISEPMVLINEHEHGTKVKFQNLTLQREQKVLAEPSRFGSLLFIFILGHAITVLVRRRLYSYMRANLFRNLKPRKKI